MVRFPSLSERSFGIGLDMPWEPERGFAAGEGSDQCSSATAAFLGTFANQTRSCMGHAFLSWQPRDRNVWRASDYRLAFANFFSHLPEGCTRVLHHTVLNLATTQDYPREQIFALTNELIDEFAIQWVNEDLGLWALDGRPLPYPLPPLFTEEGLAACVRNVREAQEGLHCPLLIEFPGFSFGTSVAVGQMHAYDHFRQVAERADCPVTLDLGHLLSYQWFVGKRGESLYEELERLPLSHCFEIHLSGCEIRGEKFLDSHHGVLLDEQLELLRRIVPLCPNLRAITYEDPRFDDEGGLIKEATCNVRALAEFAKNWAFQDQDGAERAVVECASEFVVHHTLRADECNEERLELAIRCCGQRETVAASLAAQDAQVLSDTANQYESHWRSQAHLGVGTCEDIFADTLSGLDEEDRRALWQDFLCSREFESHRPLLSSERSLCVEEAFYRFLCRHGDSEVLEHEFLAGMACVLALHPLPAFTIPREFSLCAAGYWALSRRSHLYLATPEGTKIGEVSSLLAQVLADARDGREQAQASAGRKRVAEELRRQGLWPQEPLPSHVA